MKVNISEVLKEVTEVFHRYELALITNDINTLDELFWENVFTVRYGATECLYGYDAIKEFRANRASSGLMRELQNTVITTFGYDFATTNTEFKRPNTGKLGRQSQTLVRMPEGWRIVSAHVSLMGEA